MGDKNVRSRGFTLVEIAIVMVIIGLLLGGALKGQEMITNAKINKTKSDLDQIQAAIFTYQDIYRQLPGDDPQADIHVGGTVATVSTQGDGVISGNWYQNDNRHESSLIWQHLRLANLIPGSGFEKPQNPFGDVMGITSNFAGMQGLVLCMDSIMGDIAGVIDNKFDDGQQSSGSIRVADAFGKTTYTAEDSYDLCFSM